MLAQMPTNTSTHVDEAALNANENGQQSIGVPMEDIHENISLRTTATEVRDEDVYILDACRSKVHESILLLICPKIFLSCWCKALIGATKV